MPAWFLQYYFMRGNVNVFVFMYEFVRTALNNKRMQHTAAKVSFRFKPTIIVKADFLAVL